MLPRNRQSILEVGARRGFITEGLIHLFDQVVALDLQEPPIRLDRVTPVQGDVQRLDGHDADSFDCVLCSEVLEHVPDITAAARELVRVARHEILIGVPYQQDLRYAQMTCAGCGRITPAYGHLNRFDEARLRELFAGATLVEKRLLGETRERTNALSAWLQTQAGNPYGSYDQEEPCVHCNARLTRPASRSPWARVLAGAGSRLERLQMSTGAPRPIWIHCLFRKN